MRPFEQGRFVDLPQRPRLPHPYFETPSHRVSLDSAPFGRTDAHVVVTGEGPPLLLVHGLMTTSYSWRYVLDHFGRRFTVYAPDLVGAGLSDKPLGATYSVHNLGTWIRELQQALGIGGCRVIGNSLGGAICAAALVQDPRCMDRLLIEHAPGFPELRLHALHLLLSIPGTQSLLAWLVRRDPLRWAHRNVHYFDESLKSLEEAEAYGAPLAGAGGAEAFYRYLKDAVNPRGFSRLQSELAALHEHPPVRLVYAKEDPMVSPRLGPRWQGSLPKAELCWLEGGSHFMHIDAIEAFLAFADPFLDQAG